LWFRAISDYETEDPSLLSFRQGDVINVKEKDEFSGWYKGFNFANGKDGAFPRDLVKMLVRAARRRLVVHERCGRRLTDVCLCAQIAQVARPKTTETGRKKAPTQSTYLTTRMAKSNRLSVARGPESDAAAVPDVQTAAAGCALLSLHGCVHCGRCVQCAAVRVRRCVRVRCARPVCRVAWCVF
jgi:hypothetical protein